MRLLFALALTASSAAAVAGEANCGFANCDFEQGTDGWGVWYSDDPKADITRYAYSADTTVAHAGKQSLKIVAPDESGRAFVSRASTALAPGARYEASWWVRKSPKLDEARFSVRFIFRPDDPKKAKWKMKTAIPVVFERKAEGEWHYRRGYFRVEKDAGQSVTLGLYLNQARGTLWVDDVRIRKVNPEENRIADMWLYDPYRVDLGRAPLTKFLALQEAKSPLLERAKRYNQLLVDMAFAKENVRRCLRINHYEHDAHAAETQALDARMRQAEDQLAKAYRAYGQAYLDRKSSEEADAFDRAAATLADELVAIDAAALKRIAAAAQRRRTDGQRWSPPPAPVDAGMPAISNDGRVNQIIYGNRSMYQFQEMERPLRFDPVHSTTVGNPSSAGPRQYDWSIYDKQWADIRASGIPKRSCLLLFMVLHDGCYVPPWLWEKAKSDPEILHPVQEGKLSRRGNRGQLNWWHPEVQAYAREIVTDMGRTFRERDEFLFYEFQWECYGPYVSTDKGTREVGYGKHAEAAFHRWLEAKYGSIAALNRRWGGKYTSFDALKPPPDKYVFERRHTGPLAAEWEAWREESYTDWCKLIYQAWKAADPNKPVLAGHSGLFRRFSMPDVYETCDMLGFHCGAPDQMIGTLLINSMSRYNGYKPVCQYENFWGIQEHHDRMHEELPQRHSAQKYVFRMTVWNRFLQVWWYSYTSATYLTHYDGNYFDPSYALTTLRYRTAGLPVYFEKFRRLQSALLDSRIVPPRVCMLAPTASMRNNYPYDAAQTEVRSLFKELFPRNYLFEFVPEEYFLDGRARIEDFDVLMLPYALYLSDALQAQIAQWLRAKPRLLVACGPGGLYDEIGLESGNLLAAAFPKCRLQLDDSAPTRWHWIDPADKTANVKPGRIGQSSVVLYLRPVSDLRLEPGFLAGLTQAIDRVTRRSAYDERDALEMVLREQGSRRYLCVLNPSLDDPAATTVHVQGEFTRVVDLDVEGGFPIQAAARDGDTAFALRLEPGEATIIRLDP